MLKKILIVVGILAVLVVAAFSLVVFEASSKLDKAFKDKEPEFRQYVTMSVDDQNAYVEKNLQEILAVFIGSAQNTKDKEYWENVQADPDAQIAGIALGRSIIAGYILDANSLADALNDENRKWLKADEDAAEARANKYAEFLKKYDTSKN